MLTPEQIQEARRLCGGMNLGKGMSGGRIPRAYLIHTLLYLPAALDIIEAQQAEIERLNGVIENIWNDFVTKSYTVCREIPCDINITCGSPECKKAFMDHYLKSGDEK